MVILARILSLFLILSFGAGRVAAQELIPAPPQVSASSYVLMDANSGTVLLEHNAHESLPPASLTKLMTAYIVERELANERLRMEQLVNISVTAWRTGGSRMFVKEGTQVSVEDLLRGIIIQSGNDASVAMAEHIAGSESAFADIMNQQAALLGMKDSHFMNATGLPDPQHRSSAYDMALLARATIVDFPQNYPLYAEKYFTYNSIRQPNRNTLLWRDKSVDGLKTGHTEEAGYCLVASAERDGMRLVSVVMGTNSEEARATETQKLLNYGFRYYETQNLFARDKSLLDAQIWGGATNTLALGLTEDLSVTLPRGSREQLAPTLDVPKVIRAPVEAGAKVGTLVVRMGDKVVAERPLVALQAVEEGGFFKRLWDTIKLFFVQLFS